MLLRGGVKPGHEGGLPYRGSRGAAGDVFGGYFSAALRERLGVSAGTQAEQNDPYRCQQDPQIECAAAVQHIIEIVSELFSCIFD